MDFDHVYMTVEDFAGYENLRNRGFSLAEETTTHPHSVTCRFIYFEPGAGAIRPVHYLEFVKVGDLEGLRTAESFARAEAGLAPKSDEALLAPGFALVTTDLEKEFAGIRSNENLARFEPQFSHHNYDWQRGGDTHRPGWNYLKFAKPIVDFCEVWVTEYENDPANPNRYLRALRPHRNTCYGICGCIWDCNSEELLGFIELTNSKKSKSQFKLRDGFTVWHEDSASTDFSKINSSNRFKAIVLKCADLEVFKRESDPDAVIRWQGKEAAILNPYKNGWLIVAVEQPFS